MSETQVTTANTQGGPRYTYKRFNEQFPDDEACLEWLKNRDYPNGIVCKVCQRVTKHHRIKGRKSFSCDSCGHHYHPTANTIFHKSSTSLHSWFYALYLMASTRCGISAKQIEREVGVSYKTAWRMCKQLRKLLAEDGVMLEGKVEVDETYYGGRPRRRGGKRGRGAEGKSIVVGLVQRKGRIRPVKADNISSATLTGLVREHVMPRSTVYTDELSGYARLGTMGYEHKRIHHASKVYVTGEGDIHTNTIEGFWSLLKRGIGGVYHAVSHKYLQAYLDEYAFRYNHREDADPMVLTMLGQIWWSEPHAPMLHGSPAQ